MKFQPIKKLRKELKYKSSHFIFYLLLIFLILVIILLSLLPTEIFLKQHKIWIDVFVAIGTNLAVIVALFIVWLNKQPEKSNLVFKDVSVINQDNNPDIKENIPKLLDVGRLIIKNEGKFKARSVEAYIDKIMSGGKKRNDFFPMPLTWTHGQLNKNGPTIRNIYPNQIVYLDIFNHIFDPDYVGNSSVLFAVAAGHNIDNLSKMNLGESELLIKLYQESGQVREIRLKAIWDGKSVPKIFIHQNKKQIPNSFPQKI